MSAPDTNVEKQTRRHWGPLVGIAVGLAFAGGLFLVFLGNVWEPAADDAVDGSAAVVVTD